MFNLRQTWNEVFPQPKLYALDVKVNMIDPNWPITAKVVPKSVHVNPNFLKKNPETTKTLPPVVAQVANDINLEDLAAKERELNELKRRKLELELLVTKKKVVEYEKEAQQNFNVSINKVLFTYDSINFNPIDSSTRITNATIVP